MTPNMFFPRNIFILGGHFPKWIFTEGRSTRSLWCLEKIQGPIWRSKDHLVMKGLSKNVKNHEFWRNPLFGETENWRRGVYFDAEYISAPFCHAKTPWIAIWSNLLFGLADNAVFFSFSVFWPCRIFFLAQCRRCRQVYKSLRFAMDMHELASDSCE